MLFSFIIILISCNKESKNKHQNYLLKNLYQSKTGITFKNTLHENIDHSIINYIYFYNGGGVSAGDINNDGLPDLYFVSNQEKNKLYLNKGNLQFEDITEKANVAGNSNWSTGTTMVDINNDGFLDIYVCAVSELLDFKGQNELFINNGDGTFTEKAKEYGLDFKGYSTQSYFFDYDKDGDLDVYIVNHAVHTSLSHGKASQREKRAELVGDVLLQNNNGKFIDVSKKANIFGGVNGYGLSASIADFNNDGWEDIYVCNDFHEDDYYYINQKDGTFSEELSSSFSTISRFSMGSDAADINADGYQDIITLDMLPNDEKTLKETEGDDSMLNMQTNLKNLGYKDQYSRNMLQINTNGSYFYETALFNKIADTDWSWAPLFADFDNDGHQDLFISNGILRRPNALDFKKYVSSTFKKHGQLKGLEWLFKSINEMPSGKVSNQIFKGDSKQFSEKTGDWIANKPSLSNGAIYVDLDLDGDLDIVSNNVNDFATILENTTNSKNYLSVKLNYKHSNKEAIGAKVSVYSKSKNQTKQVFKSRGFLSSIESKLHFGIDTIKSMDSLTIIWPNNKYQIIKNPKINSEIVVNYSEESKPFNFKNSETKNPLFKKTEFISYTHKEDNYNDFFNERLIPYKVSTLGPAVAIGDIDKNGFDDIFIGGASGNPSEIYLNNGKSFIKSTQKELEKDASFEDNDAAFFDADNDGDLDLYVASGINSERNQNFEIDRLYFNQNGKFVKSKKKTLINPLNTSTVAPYDYDGDGDVDLFIGNLSITNNFGQFVNSAILENDGNGKFTANLNFKINSKVTSATWIDINNDNQKDLLISTEWDAPKIFINKKGNLTELTIPENLNGLWQTITAFDIDKDGDKDILLGNWGENTKFQKYIKKPMYLYHGDFDNNDKKESVITYNVNGIYYPLNSKDELASQMNIINKRFVDHASFAKQHIEKVLTQKSVDEAVKHRLDVLSSGYIENNNGTFTTFKRFDNALQTAPINSFTNIKINNEDCLLVSGNSEKPTTYHGSFNSLKGLILKSNTTIEQASNYGIEPFNTQIKKTVVVKMKNKNVLFVFANNNTLKTYTFKN